LEYRRRFLDLTQSEGRLEAISTRVDEGDTVISAELATRIALIDLRNNNSRIADIRRAVTQLCTTEQPPVTDSEPAEQAISRLTSYVLGLQLSSKLHPQQRPTQPSRPRIAYGAPSRRAVAQLRRRLAASAVRTEQGVFGRGDLASMCFLPRLAHSPPRVLVEVVGNERLYLDAITGAVLASVTR
jgi:hypothetical protein